MYRYNAMYFIIIYYYTYYTSALQQPKAKDGKAKPQGQA